MCFLNGKILENKKEHKNTSSIKSDVPISFCYQRHFPSATTPTSYSGPPPRLELYHFSVARAAAIRNGWLVLKQYLCRLRSIANKSPERRPSIK